MANRAKCDWKSPMYEELCPSVADWARMAAYIDGEGTICINVRRNRQDYNSIASGFYLRITIANTDARLPLWLKQTFGGSFKDSNSKRYYEGKNWKRCWAWNTASNRAAWILFNCLPYFVMKTEQAGIGISLQESMNKQIKSLQLPQEVVEERRALKKRLLTIKSRGVLTEPEQQKRIDEVA